VSPACALLILAASSQGEAWKKAAEAAGPSVVALRNDEGYGSGMVLDDAGLILTNAHVVCSPLPFRVEVNGLSPTGPRLYAFRKVVIVGIHPEYDLALVRVDPREQPVKLRPVRLAERGPNDGDTIYAIGFPSTEGGQRKILTEGVVESTSRRLLDGSYFSHTAVIAPGNSGGPLCNEAGDVVAVNTFVLYGEEPEYLAIPVSLAKPSRFVALRDRRPNPALVSEFVAMGDRCLKAAQSGSRLGLEMAVHFYLTALTHDFNSPEMYSKLGTLHRNAGRFGTATAYLVRALRLQPWPDSGSACYHELGVSLVESGRAPDAILAWNEGIAKYGAESPKIWDDLAIFWANRRNWLEAAYCSRVAFKTFAGRGEVMNKLYRSARNQLTPDQAHELQDRESGIDAMLERMKASSGKAREEGRPSLTKEFEAFLKSFEGAQKESWDPRLNPSDPEGPRLADDEVNTAFIQVRLRDALDHHRKGQKDKAIEILEGLIKSFPKHPDTAEVRRTLELIRSK
jgi:tetratricopeptide (TPR) repeat protein